MLRRVIITPTHYLKHSVAVLACNSSARKFLCVRFRWSVATKEHSQLLEEAYAEECIKVGGPASPLVPFQKGKEHPSLEQLAIMFTQFVESYGQNTGSALHCLQSATSSFPEVHRIFQTRTDVSRVANHLACSSTPAVCFQLLSLAVAYGTPLNTWTYERVCWNLAKSNRWSVLLEVCHLYKDSHDALSLRLLNWRLRASCALENFTVLDGILQEFEDAGVTPTRLTWDLILSGHLRNRNLAAARECLRSMEEAGFPLDPTTHATIAATYRYLGLDPRVRDLVIPVLGTLPLNTSVSVVNQLLKSHIDFNDELGFRQLLSLFDKDTFSPIQSILAPSGNLGGINFPTLNVPYALPPNINTFLIVIRFCIASSLFSSAEKIFLVLKQRGVQCTPNILATYLDLHFCAHHPEFAVSVAAQMLEKENLEDLFDQLGNRAKVEFNEEWPFSSSHIAPHISIFNALLKGVLGFCGLDGAHVVLQLLKRTHIEPDSRTLGIVLSHLLRVEHTPPSFVLRMLRQISSIYRPTLQHIHLLVSQVLRNERHRLRLQRRSRNFHQGMQQDRHPEHWEESSDDSSNGPLGKINLGRYLKRPSLARSIIQSLTSRGVRSDPCLMELRIRHDAVIKSDMTAAMNTYSNMLSRGITPTEYHIAALMDGFVQQDEMDTAVRVMRSAQQHNIKPNVVMYTILIWGYARRRQPRMAMRLFQTMVTGGVQPDVRAVHAVCTALVLAGQLGLARKLLIALWTYIQPFPPDYAELPLKQLLQLFCALDTTSSGRGLSVKQRIRLHHELSKIAIEYKRCSGLRYAILSHSRDAKRTDEASSQSGRKQ